MLSEYMWAMTKCLNKKLHDVIMKAESMTDLQIIIFLIPKILCTLGVLN